MVKHIVLFKLKDQADRQKAIEVLSSMKGMIEGMIDLEVGEDFLASERSYDIALITAHTDRAALDFYQAHPVHQPVKKVMHAIRESSIAVDFEVNQL
ncbi:MAG: Dabb family protein [Firmicutes bacterium]|nr:Dabb family protein [Bacillota bacterium]